MKRILLTLCLLVICMPAQAVSRYNAPVLTCQRIQTILNNDGSAILRYPSPRDAQLTLYDLYVKSRAFCQSGEQVISASVPSKDNRRCQVRQCEQNMDSQNNR
ncbi:MAG: hypothetical protein P1V21_01745 [Rhizobiaceae bacterium]|nr:hypothetical protein [Rhizobiaceae bacterium]